jgi:hypothetical protein
MVVKRQQETFEPMTMGHIRSHGCRDLLLIAREAGQAGGGSEPKRCPLSGKARRAGGLVLTLRRRWRPKFAVMHNPARTAMMCSVEPGQGK